MGRTSRALAAGALALVLAGCWPVPGQNADRTGHNGFESTLSPANVATLTQKWAFPAANPTGQPMSDPVASTAGIHSTTGCGLATVDPATGATRWTVFLPSLQVCSLPGGFGGSRAHEPWVDGDVVYAGWEAASVMAPGPPRPPSYGAATDGFDIDTGAAAGRLSNGVLKTRRDSTIGTTRGAIDANGSITYTDNLRHLEGDEGFTFPAGTMERSTVGSFGIPVLFTGANGSVQAYDTGASGDGCGPGTTTACLSWETPVDGWASRPVLSGGGNKVYVAAGSTVYGLDGISGSIEWTGSLGAPASAAPALADGVLYVPTTTTGVVAFTAGGCGGVSPCAPLWSAATGSSISEQPAVAGGVVFTGSRDGTLHAFDAAGCGATTCPALWTASTDGSAISGAPMVSSGRLFAGTTNGRLFAFGLA